MSFEHDLKLQVLQNEWIKERKINTNLELQLIKKVKEIKDFQKENADLRVTIDELPTKWKELTSVLSTLLWKASNSTHISGPVLKAKKILSFLSHFIVQSFRSFIQLDDLFTKKDEDLKLITSLAGFLVNICGLKQGFEIIINDANGRLLQERLLELFEHIDSAIPISHIQKYLKSILLMILYNVSLNTAGYRLLKQNLSFVDALCREVLTQSDIQIKTLELRIVHSLLSHNECNMYKRISRILLEEKLQDLELYDEGVMLVNSILELYKDLSDFFIYDDVLQLHAVVQDDVCLSSDDDFEVDIDEEYITELMAESGSPIRRMNMGNIPSTQNPMNSGSWDTFHDTIPCLSDAEFS